MRKLKLYIASSLDGKIAREDGAIDWLPDPTGEDYGYQELYDSVDTTLMGYKTYELCLTFGEWHYKDKITFVFTRDPNKCTIPEARSISSDVIKFVTDLKQSEGKDIWLIGGGEFIALLHNAGLIDEYIVAVIPLILGKGIELFPQISRQENLNLFKHKIYDNGCIMLYYKKSQK